MGSFGTLLAALVAMAYLAYELYSDWQIVKFIWVSLVLSCN